MAERATNPKMQQYERLFVKVKNHPRSGSATVREWVTDENNDANIHNVMKKAKGAQAGPVISLKTGGLIMPQNTKRRAMTSRRELKSASVPEFSFVPNICTNSRNM